MPSPDTHSPASDPRIALVANLIKGVADACMPAATTPLPNPLEVRALLERLTPAERLAVANILAEGIFQKFAEHRRNLAPLVAVASSAPGADIPALLETVVSLNVLVASINAIGSTYAQPKKAVEFAQAVFANM